MERQEERNGTHIHVRQEGIFEVDLESRGVGIPALDVGFPKHQAKRAEAHEHNDHLKKQCWATFHAWSFHGARMAQFGEELDEAGMNSA
jgi:hypothetical protein